MTIEALTAQEENAEADKLIGSLQNGGGAVVNTRMCYMCFDDIDEPGNPLVSAKYRLNDSVAHLIFFSLEKGKLLNTTPLIVLRRSYIIL